jgi:hypothetical protein
MVVDVLNPAREIAKLLITATIDLAAQQVSKAEVCSGSMLSKKA